MGGERDEEGERRQTPRITASAAGSHIRAHAEGAHAGRKLSVESVRNESSRREVVVSAESLRKDDHAEGRASTDAAMDSVCCVGAQHGECCAACHSRSAVCSSMVMLFSAEAAALTGVSSVMVVDISVYSSARARPCCSALVLSALQVGVILDLWIYGSIESGEAETSTLSSGSLRGS